MEKNTSDDALVGELLNLELAADFIDSKININEDQKSKTSNIIKEFIQSYRKKPTDHSDIDWLKKEFKRYPDIWEHADESDSVALDIVNNIGEFNQSRESLDAHLNKGMSRNNWLAGKIEQAAKVNGVKNLTEYSTEIESAIKTANENNTRLIFRNDGELNKQLNLDGFIAEHQHVNDFNLDAAAKGSGYRAKVLEPSAGEAYGKNSVDIVIYDSKGKVVKRYQSKYGADAKATDKLFKKGDYQGQRKLVPKNQTEDIKNSTDKIEIDGVSSKPISKEEVKEQQKKAQEQAEIKKYEWNDANRIEISKSIGKLAVVSAGISVGYQGARVFGKRLWNSLTGKENNSLDDDLEEFVNSSIKSATNTGLAVAVTGGVTVAVKSGWLGEALKATPVGRIANSVCVGIENIKVLSKYAKGEITGAEALDKSASITVSTIGAIAMGTKGASIGAAVGSVLGPVGTVFGGLAGGIVGSIGGSTLAESVYEGGKKIVSTAASAIKSVGSSIASSASNFCSGVSNFLFG